MHQYEKFISRLGQNGDFQPLRLNISSPRPYLVGHRHFHSVFEPVHNYVHLHPFHFICIRSEIGLSGIRLYVPT